MITAADVQRVARTAVPHTVKAGAILTITDLIMLTTADDWDGNLYELHLRPAEQIAMQFNTTHKLNPLAKINGRKQKKLVHLEKTDTPTETSPN